VLAQPAALKTRPAIFLTTLLVGVAVLLGSVAPAGAVKPEKKFKQKIIVSEKRFPSRFDSDGQFVRHMKKVDTRKLTAEDDDDWTFHYMAFLPEPVSTLKATVTYYDVTNPGQKKMIDTFSFYPGDREDKIVAGYAKLSPEKFDSRRKYLMEFSRGYGQKPLARTHITLRRKGEKKDDGVVDFTKSEKGKEKATKRD
jgi:hypothetical protein